MDNTAAIICSPQRKEKLQTEMLCATKVSAIKSFSQLNGLVKGLADALEKGIFFYIKAKAAFEIYQQT